MFSLAGTHYKAKLISLYVGITFLGIILTLVAIYNASREQLYLDHINNTHSLFQDQLGKLDLLSNTSNQVAEKLSSNAYQVLSMRHLGSQNINFNECTVQLTENNLEESRLNSIGGIFELSDCIVSWLILDSKNTEGSWLVLHQFDLDQQSSSIISAYTNRLVVPLVFFGWMAVWGSLMLGNLINRLRLQKEAVEEMALHDMLTGLPNRKYFSETIHQLLDATEDKRQPFTLAMVDLNKFKSVNDELGHSYGDQLLKQVAKRFKQGIGEHDMVARLGGDEFILLLMGADRNANLDMLEEIYSSVIAAYKVLDKNVIIGASIGVSYYPDHDGSYSDLLHKADVAMYRAKGSGGGIKVFDSLDYYES